MDSGSTIVLIALIGAVLVFFWSSAADTALPLLRRSQVRESLDEGGIRGAAIRRLRSDRIAYEDAVWFVTITAGAAASALVVALLVRESGLGWLLMAVILAGFWLVILAMLSATDRVVDRLGVQKLVTLGVSVQMAFWPLLRPARLGRSRPRAAAARAEAVVGAEPGEPSEPELEVEDELADETLDHHERAMIHAILHLDETPVREIMVPRVDMVSIDVATPIEDAIPRILESGHSRLPAYEESSDNVTGIIYSRDLLAATVRGQGAAPAELREMVRPCFFVPESKRVHEMLTEFQQRRVHLAVVVDEYGGVAGLVTIEDVLEEIVGEVADEFDVDEPALEWDASGNAVVDARLPVDDFNGQFGAAIIPEGFDTLGGFLFGRLGKIPMAGDAVVEEGLRIQVVSTSGRRIRKVRITRVPKHDVEPAPSEASEPAN